MILAAAMVGVLVAATADMRVEIYEEIDRGDPKAGADKHVTPDGKVYGMGSADHRPVVRRCVLELDAKSRAALPQEKLTFLPYFREAKPEITLATYFEALSSGQASALLPASLAGYLTHPAATRATLDTLVEPESTGVNAVVIVWADARRWYVDHMFYRFTSFDAGSQPRTTCDDVFTGSLASFLRDSPLIATKRTEGRVALRHPQAPPWVSTTTRVLELRLSPGMPNTSSFMLEVFADGAYRYTSDGAASTGFEPHRLGQLLADARRAGLDRVSTSRAVPLPGHDQQVTSLRLQLDRTRVDAQLGSDTPQALMDFVAKVKKAYAIDL